MNQLSQTTRITEFFYNLNENIHGIIDKIEFLPIQINNNTFVCGMRLLSSSYTELHVKILRTSNRSDIHREELMIMTPESESWVGTNNFSEDTLKLVLNDAIEQVDKLTEYHILLTKLYEDNKNYPNIEIILFPTKRTAYKEIMRIKRQYNKFLCTYKVLDKFGRLQTLKTYKNLTNVENKHNITLTNTSTTQQQIYMTDMELVTCNINDINI